MRSSLKDKSQKTCSRILKVAICNLVALLFSNHALHGFAHMGELGGVVLGRGLQLALQLFQSCSMGLTGRLRRDVADRKDTK